MTVVMRWIRFLATLEASLVDRTTYAADSVWHMPSDRAGALVEAGVAEYCAPPAAALRDVTEPLEPLPPSPDDAAADPAAAEE